MKFGYACTFTGKPRGDTPAPPPEKSKPRHYRACRHAEVCLFRRRRLQLAARLAGKCARIAKFHEPHSPTSVLAKPRNTPACASGSLRIVPRGRVVRTLSRRAYTARPHRCAGMYRQSCGKASRLWLRSHWASIVGCKQSSFELLSIAAVILGDYLNSVSVVEILYGALDHQEPVLLISDNASGISGKLHS